MSGSVSRRVKKATTLWPLSKKECVSQSPPHRIQLVVVERDGNSQVCVLCGTTLVKARKAARPRHSRQVA